MTERGASPFLLDETDDAWLVVEGSVDVFAVPLGEDWHGPRRHLWSAEAGDVIPPAPRRDDARVAWMAAGVGTSRLRRIATSDLAQPELAPALDRLIANLASMLPVTAHPTLHEILLPGLDLTLSQGRRAGVRDCSLWLRHLEGSSRVANCGLELTPAIGWVPLHGLWIEAGDLGARVQVRDTAAQVEAGDVSGLNALIAFAQTAVAESMAEERIHLEEQLNARVESDRRIWSGALGNLASILESRNASELATRSPSALIAACRLVGSAAGIEFREPAAWETESGTNLLTALCRASQVRSRRVALRGAWWSTDAGPLLGYLANDATPVALLPAGVGRYVVVDPRTHAKEAVTSSVAATLQPFAVTFHRPLPTAARTLRDLAAFVAPMVRSDAAGIATMALASGLLALAVPIATAHVFNEVIPNARPADLLTILVALTATAFGTALFDITRAFSLTRTEGRISAAMQIALVDRLLALPVPFFRRFAIGDLSQRASAISAVQEALGTSTLTVIVGGVFAAVNLLVLFYYDWALALLGILLILAAATVNMILVRASLRHERQQQETQARVAGFVFQMISGIAKLRTSGSEKRAFANWSSAFARQREAAFRAGHFKAMLNVFNDVLPVITTAMLFGVGGWLMFAHGAWFRTGDFVAFSAAFGALFSAVVALSNTTANIVSAVAVMEKAAPILETTPEVTESQSDPGELVGLIEGTHLSFRYHEDGPLVLDDVSFRAEPGQFVAFVGPSGSGKSTTLRMLLGFERPETGAVYYDGQDLASLDVTAIRHRQLGVVLQSSRLLGGDIFTNIVGASSTRTLDEAWEAAEAAGLADDIRAMPMGMHTVISEGGSTFSGGQRQRLLIARALVRKPRIILFDEATSALDNRTQATVTRTLELSSATRIVIAHRLSTIRSADRIFVMNQGRIEESGSFEELARSRGLFSQLIARQHA
jgi:ATP-binding cassette subfamily C protein